MSLIVPRGFEVASEFPGIIRRDASASVHVVELSVSADDVRSGLRESQLAAQGIELLRSEKVSASIRGATLLHVSLASQGVEFRKWILAGGTATRSVLLTAAVPAVLEGELRSVLLDTLLTARWESAGDEARRKPGDFSVAASPRLEIAEGRSADLVTLVRSHERESIGVGDPYMIVSRCEDRVSASELPLLSMTKLAGSSSVGGIMIEEESETRIDGLPAYEIVASGLSPGRGRVVIYQAYVSNRNHCFSLRGTVSEELRDPYVDEFRAVAKSLSVER